MDLDRCIDLLSEGQFDFLNKYRTGKGNSLFDMENARQERIEKQIASAKKNGASAEEIAKLEKKLGADEVVDKFGKETNKKTTEKNSNEPTEIIKRLNAQKGKLYKGLVEFCNLTGGVGLEGDKNIENATRQSVSKDEEGNENKITSGIPSDSVLRAKLAELKADAEYLKNLEYGYSNEKRNYGGASKEYFKAKQNSSVELLKILNSIHISQLDWDEQSVPMHTNARYITNRNGETNINSFDPDEAKNMPRSKLAAKGLGIGAKAIGKKRFNADIYEDLYPFIQEFKKYSKNYSAHNIDFVKDSLSNNTSKYDERYKEMEKAMLSSDEDYEKRRKIERGLDELGNAKNYKDETGKIDHADYNGARARAKLAERELYAKDGKKGTTGFLEEKGIQKLTIKNFLKKCATWKEKDANHVLKIFGTMPVLGNAGGILVFGPASLNADGKPAPNQAQYEGLYAFQVTNYFFNNMGAEARKFTEDKRVSGRTKSEWKEGALKALGLKSIMTEEINYFPY